MDVQTPAARNTDPRTSHIAADLLTASGQRASQRERVVEGLRRYGDQGITTRELAERLDMDRHQVARRMKECETAGEAIRGETVKRSPQGRPEEVWRPVPVQTALL